MRACAFFLSLLLASASYADTLVYFGTYTRGDSNSEGIYVSSLDPSSGRLSPPRLAAKAANPSFVAIHPNGNVLYAVSEVSGPDGNSGGVIAFAIEADGTLRKLNEQPSGGGGACHVAVDPTGRCVAVANYGGGSCASFPIRDDGSLGSVASFHQHIGGSGVNPRRQSSPHAHSVNFSPDAEQAFVADLGMDQIRIYDVNAQLGTLKPAEPPMLKLPAGGGPRHFSFAPSGEVAFSNLEMTSKVVMLNYDAATNELSEGPILSTLPETGETDGNSTAECLTHPSEPFVYVSNRGHNSIAGFRYSADPLRLEAIGHTSSGGEIPRGFGIAPSGKFLVVANQRSGNVVTLRIDGETGKLTPTGHEIQIGAPVNVRFVQRTK